MRRMHTVLSLLFLVTGMVLFASPAYPQPNVLHPVEGRPAAPGFVLKDIDNTVHRLSDYRGKVVIVNFWATWCPPCRFELPSMEKLWAAVRDKDVVMLAINVGEDADTIFTFTSDYPVTFPLLMDRDSSVTQAYPVLGIPTSFILDPQGRIVYRAVGTREWDDEAIIRDILSLQGNKPN